MASTVTLKYGELTETIPLFEGRLHIPTINDAFTLRVPRIDGVLAPVDSQGFTYAIFKPGDTLNISGTSAEVAAMPGTLYSMELLQWHKHKVHMLQSINIYQFVLYITAVILRMDHCLSRVKAIAQPATGISGLHFHSQTILHTIERCKRYLLVSMTLFKSV